MGILQEGCLLPPHRPNTQRTGLECRRTHLSIRSCSFYFPLRGHYRLYGNPICDGSLLRRSRSRGWRLPSIDHSILYRCVLYLYRRSSGCITCHSLYRVRCWHRRRRQDRSYCDHHRPLLHRRNVLCSNLCINPALGYRRHTCHCEFASAIYLFF